ncbi:MAG: four helix bundle protein [Candidatus Vogelbacteria bacterium]|nr:four helix bundle protein [Candidatus Vogelbacteria bacterium]
MSIVHKLREFYLTAYLVGKKLPKRERFGLWGKIETVILEVLVLLIEAGLSSKINKLPILERTRIKIETIKQLVRLSNEGKIIEEKAYLDQQNQLQEISRMLNGWIRYTQKEP